jgi:peroxisomal 2,4-dienoyl-CoA reductase
MAAKSLSRAEARNVCLAPLPSFVRKQAVSGFVACDVREGEQVESALKKCVETLGGLDIVVNGAAGNLLSPAAAFSYNGFKTVMAIDTLGTCNVSKAAFRVGLRRTGGVILNISATLH